MRVDTSETVAAVVRLRSASGKSVRDLSTEGLSMDVEAYRAPREARDAVRRAFESRGFGVIPDAQLLTLTLQGPHSLFASCFGVPEATLDAIDPDSPIELEAPADLKDLVEAITLLPFTPAAAPPGAAVLAGATIGRFRITAHLGSGGMGEVYRAEDTQLKRTVAIKRLVPRQHDQAVSNNDLLREARRASALNHPRIAGIYDVFTVGDELFLVMEYIDGVTLRDRLQSPLTVSEFCSIAIQCTHALAAAHHKGIVHGDLKPTNIMLAGDAGDVKVCDFGLARRLPKVASEIETTSTARHGIVGTPAYMAPEVVREEPPDERSDVFSLGVVFYEMLAGRNPFAADSLIATIDRIRGLSPEPLDLLNPDVPPRLARAIQRMIEKDPSNRYADVSELSQDLATIQDQLPRFQRRRHSRTRAALGLAIGTAIVAIVFGIAHLQGLLGSAPVVAPIPSAVNLAILPFGSAGAGADRQFFTQGLAEALTRQFSTLTLNRRFQVATMADVRARHVTNPTEARDQLGANVVLSGSLLYSGPNVRITCLLIDTRSGRPLRSETFTADASNPIAVQDLVTNAGIRMMGLDIKPDERKAVPRARAQGPSAYDFYLQARGYLLNFDRVENLDSAIAVFRRALEIDPRYALAYAGLGQAYWRKHELTGAAMWVDPARGACESALGMDPKLSEAHACLAIVLNGTGAYERAANEFATALDLEPTNDVSYLGLATAYERLARPADAERTFRRAIELRPHYWAAYDNLGAYYYRVGRYDDALAMFQQVVALVPDSFRGYSSLGAVYFMKDQTTEAIAAFRKSLDIRPNYLAASNLGTLYFFEGDYRQSVDAFRQALSLDESNYQVWGNLAGALESLGDSARAAAAYKRERELVQERLTVNPRDASLHMALAECNAALGETAKARASLAQVLKLAPADPQTLLDIAVFFEFRLHQREEALKWLAEAIARGQPWREVDRSPLLIALRKDPRFQQLRHDR
jgi:tetratricopeptide (TPR) repeat protein/tRNA A-37 threonylcarbamoyl transferase component Bud32